MNKTETTAALHERLEERYTHASQDWTKGDVRAFLEELENLVEQELGNADEGTVVIGNVVRIRKVHQPARPAGEYAGFGGEMKHYDKRPASTKLRVAIPKGLKDKVL